MKICKQGHEYEPGNGCQTCNRELNAWKYSQKAEIPDKSAGQGTNNTLSGIPMPHPRNGRRKRVFWTSEMAHEWWDSADGGTKWQCLYVPGMKEHMGWPNITLVGESAVFHVEIRSSDR